MSSGWRDQSFGEEGEDTFFQLEGRVHLPDTSHSGWFDYATAIVGINEVHDRDAVPEVHGDTALFPIAYVARIHETSHALQSVAFPFFWRWCVVWRRLVLDTWERCFSASTSMRESLRTLPTSLPPDLESQVGEHLDLLTAPGPYGLSVLQLLEAHAMLSEIWALARQDSVTDVCTELERNSPNDGYRLAFDVVRLAVGDDVAVDVFAPLVTAAFCFDEPVTAFAQLLGRLSALPSSSCAGVTVDDLCRSSAGTGLAEHFYGLPSEQARVLASLEPAPHARHCRHLLDVFARTGVDLDDVLADRRQIHRGIEAMRPTTLYAPDEDGHATVVLGGADDEPDATTKDSAQYREYRTERFLMTISQRLLRAVEAQAAPDVSPAYSWLPFVSEERLPLRVPLPLRRSTPQDVADHLTASLSIREVRAPVQRATTGVAYLGHGELEFATDSPLEVWQDPEARAVVRAISDTCPEFPLFLRPDQTTLVVWFGSLTDLDGVTAAGFDPGHPTARRELVRFVDAVEHCVEVTGLDLRPLVRLLLRPLQPG